MVVSAIHGDEEARGGVEKKTPKANPEWRPRFHGGISRIYLRSSRSRIGQMA
jgi:hypothetical protein